MSAQGIRAGRAFVEVGADSGPLDAALSRLRGRMQSFGRGLSMVGGSMVGGAAAVLGPLAVAAKMFTTAGDQMHKMAIRTGVSAEHLSALGFAAEQSGTNVEAVGDALFRVSRLAADAAAGNAAASQAFADLGLDAAKLAGMSPDKQLMAFADALLSVTDAGQRAHLAYGIFGRKAQDLMPLLAGGGAAIEQMTARAAELGLVMSTDDANAAAALGDAMNEMQRAISGAWVRIGAAVAPVITRMATEIATVIGQISNWINENRGLVVGVGAVAVAVGAAGGALLGLGALSMVASAALGVILSPLGLLAAGAAAVYGAFKLWPALFESIRSSASGIVSILAVEFGDIGAGFQTAVGTMRSTWQSVVAAIASGDMGAAADVAFAGLSVAWLQVIQPMRDRWYGVVDAIQDYWADASNGIAAAGFQAVGFLRAAWQRVMTWMGGMIDYLQTKLKTMTNTLIGLLKQDPATARHMNEKEKQAYEQRQARRTAQGGLNVAEIESETADFLKVLADMAEEERKARTAGRGNDLAAAEQRAKAAQERFAELQAKVNKPGPGAAGGASLSSAVGEAMGKSGQLAGTFNATMAAQQMGIKQTSERTAKATETMARGINALVKKADAGSGILVGS